MDVSSSSLLSHLDDAPREVRNEEDGSEPRARAQGVEGQLAGAQRHVVQPVIEDGEEDGRAADGDERVVEALGEGWHGLCDSRCSVGGDHRAWRRLAWEGEGVRRATVCNLKFSVCFSHNIFGLPRNPKFSHSRPRSPFHS